MCGACTRALSPMCLPADVTQQGLPQVFALGEVPGGIANNAEPIGVVQMFSTSASASAGWFRMPRPGRPLPP